MCGTLVGAIRLRRSLNSLGRSENGAVVPHSSLAFLSLAVVVASTSAGSDAGRVRIVSAAELARELPRASVLDARGEKAFREGHVSGSLPVDWKDWTLEKPGFLSLVAGHAERWGKVPPADETLARRLRELGLSNGRPIVVVGDPRGWGEEGRIAWNLLFWGAEDVALLDGGFPAWAAAHPVESRPPHGGPPGDFTVRVRPERRIDADVLETSREKRAVLDARTVEEWNGMRMKGQKRGGHIPGARLVPYQSLYRKDGTYVDADELRRLTGVVSGAPAPAAYCVGGVRSALLALLLEARLGILTPNYDGSIWEWAARKELPLTTAPNR
jgi:thiosulfate/3-mercaptopyruvate sulfurtransferase